MSIATAIERIVGKQCERQAARAADFRDVVVQIADGREPDADFVAQVLHEAGKSLDDLQRAVELLQRRRELRQKLDSLPRLMAKQRQIEQQLAAINGDLEAAEKRHEELYYPLQAELTDLRQAIPRERLLKSLDRQTGSMHEASYLLRRRKAMEQKTPPVTRSNVNVAGSGTTVTVPKRKGAVSLLA